ncbi:mRNA-capping enzyme [Anthonomus grandis grandis]|uniref:mRNA-capping enzyme n=1 Tax=Anthonomus grandis grandis TaxID=2921223 RepID=UPI0021664BA6|nr:mRNA-capping enzyme [Anthonomus grandis grandis]
MSKNDWNGPGPVPNRWLKCPRKADRLIVNKFIALKTPLSTDFDDQVPAECRFHPKMFFDICKAKKMKVGLWIDLTNTKRFYDPAEVEAHDCRYIKLQCRGHGETPSDEQAKRFIEVVHNFIIKYPLELIAVHCTHGFNRTGFLIISYLVERMDLSLDIALQTFAEARPVGIYKQDYLTELYRRYDDIDDAPLAPDLPDWCLEFDDSNEKDNEQVKEFEPSTSDQSNNSSAPVQQQQRKKSKKSNVQFMDGVPGVTHFNEQPKAHNLQKKVQSLCGWKTKGFPGCQPVSMDVNNISLLSMKPYRVSWKADGMRYMMLIDGENEVYFFDRNHSVFRVEGLKFPNRKNLRGHLKNTLLDGEMVIDKVDGEDIPRYLVYDIVAFEGQDVSKMPFYPKRLQYLEYEIIKPRYTAMEQSIINKNLEPFSIRKKDFWPITQAHSLLGEKFARSLSHEPDGLIFQPSNEPYVAGRCDEVLKWKPLDLNSVDFRLKIVKENGLGLVGEKVGFLYVGGFDYPFGKMKYTKALKDLDGKIIECKLENEQWKFMRVRTDKTFPNSYDTAQAVFHSIKNPVTKEKLLHYIDHYKYENDAEMMPPPAKRTKR